MWGFPKWYLKVMWRNNWITIMALLHTKSPPKCDNAIKQHSTNHIDVWNLGGGGIQRLLVFIYISCSQNTTFPRNSIPSLVERGAQSCMKATSRPFTGLPRGRRVKKTPYLWSNRWDLNLGPFLSTLECFNHLYCFLLLCTTQHWSFFWSLPWLAATCLVYTVVTWY